MVVEIHWRLFSSAFMWSESGDEPLSTMSVEVGTRALKTLSRIDLFLYLCVHGAIHRFAILKWIADIAAMLRAMTREQFAQVVARASSLGVIAEMNAALNLIEGMLSVSAPCPIASGKADSQAMWIVEASYATLTKGESSRTALQLSRIPATHLSPAVAFALALSSRTDARRRDSPRGLGCHRFTRRALLALHGPRPIRMAASA